MKPCPIVVDDQPCSSGQRIVLGNCLFHYKQLKAGRELTRWTPRRKPGSSLVRDAQGRKECSRCLDWRPVERFSPCIGSADGLQAWCSRCTADYMSLNRWGLTRAQVDALVVEQGGCAICQRPEPGGSDYRRGWHVDHDHACCPGPRSCGKCVRGVLCGRCNTVLGLAADGTELLLASVEYLRLCEARHQENR